MLPLYATYENMQWLFVDLSCLQVAKALGVCGITQDNLRDYAHLYHEIILVIIITLLFITIEVTVMQQQY